MGEFRIVNSKNTRDNYINYVDEMLEKHKYLTFTPPRIGADRSIDQNSLFHVWLSESAAYLSKCDEKEVTLGMIDGTKRTVKSLFYREYRYEWMIHEVKCAITGNAKKDWTSSSKWSAGQMFMVLEFMQNLMAAYGIILESKGKFKKLQGDQKV